MTIPDTSSNWVEEIRHWKATFNYIAETERNRSNGISAASTQ